MKTWKRCCEPRLWWLVDVDNICALHPGGYPFDFGVFWGLECSGPGLLCLHEGGHAMVLAGDVACQSETGYLQVSCCFPVGPLK